MWNAIKRAGRAIERETKKAGRWVARQDQKSLALAGMGPLAVWITASRGATMGAGVRPIPSAMRTILVPYFSPQLLDGVRFRVGKGPWLALPRLGFVFGDAKAMTLDYVIVFKEQDGAANPRMWAHECVHVRQFREWGIPMYSYYYIFDKNSVEREARDFANQHF